MCVCVRACVFFIIVLKRLSQSFRNVEKDDHWFLARYQATLLIYCRIIILEQAYLVCLLLLLGTELKTKKTCCEVVWCRNMSESYDGDCQFVEHTNNPCESSACVANWQSLCKMTKVETQRPLHPHPSPSWQMWVPTKGVITVISKVFQIKKASISALPSDLFSSKLLLSCVQEKMLPGVVMSKGGEVFSMLYQLSDLDEPKWVCVCVCECECVCVNMCVSVNVCVWMWVWVCVRMWMCVCVCQWGRERGQEAIGFWYTVDHAGLTSVWKERDASLKRFILCELFTALCEVFVREWSGSKLACRLLCHSVCLSPAFAVLPLCYVLNLSLVFDIFDIVCDGIMWETLDMWNRCSGTLFHLLAFCHGNKMNWQISVLRVYLSNFLLVHFFMRLSVHSFAAYVNRE